MHISLLITTKLRSITWSYSVRTATICAGVSSKSPVISSISSLGDGASSPNSPSSSRYSSVVSLSCTTGWWLLSFSTLSRN